MQSFYHDRIHAEARRDVLLAEAQREKLAAGEPRPLWLTDRLVAGLGDVLVWTGQRLQRARFRPAQPLPVYPEFVRD